jgi:hypothetical protein
MLGSLRRAALLLGLAGLLAAGCSPPESTRPGTSPTTAKQPDKDGKPAKQPNPDPG